MPQVKNFKLQFSLDSGQQLFNGVPVVTIEAAKFGQTIEWLHDLWIRVVNHFHGVQSFCH